MIRPAAAAAAPRPVAYVRPQIFEQRTLWHQGAPLYIRPLTSPVQDVPLAHRAALSRLHVPRGAPALVLLEGFGPPVRYLVGWVREDLVRWHIARRQSAP